MVTFATFYQVLSDKCMVIAVLVFCLVFSLMNHTLNPELMVIIMVILLEKCFHASIIYTILTFLMLINFVMSLLMIINLF